MNALVRMRRNQLGGKYVSDGQSTGRAEQGRCKEDEESALNRELRTGVARGPGLKQLLFAENEGVDVVGR